MLEQATTFSPLVQEFVILTQIACRTGYDKVLRPVRPSTTQRNNMVNMICFAYFFMAVIALSLLPLVLCLNIFSRMSTSGFTFKCASFMSCQFVRCLTLIRSAIAMLTFQYRLVVTYSIIFICSASKIRIFITSLVSSCNFYMSQSVCTLPIINILPRSLIRWTPGLFASAFFTLIMKSIRRITFGMEELFCEWQILLAPSAGFKTFWRFMVTYVVTRFTSPAQTIFSILGRKEKLAGCRKGLLAFKTSLQYNVTHGRTNLLSSHLRLLE